MNKYSKIKTRSGIGNYYKSTLNLEANNHLITDILIKVGKP